MQHLSIQNLLDVFKEHLKGMVAILLVTVTLVGVYTFFIADKVYESKATLMIGIPREYLGSGQFSDANQDQSGTVQDSKNISYWVSTYSTAIKSENVTNQVTAQLGYNVTSDQITLTQLNDTQFMRLAVTADSSAKAQQIAATTIPIFRDYIAAMLKVDNLDVVEEASREDQPISPRVSRNLLLGILLGMILAVLYALMRNSFDYRVHRPEDIKSITGSPVLAIVPVSAQLSGLDQRKKFGKKKNEPAQKCIVVENDPKSMEAEVFRNLRTNVLFTEVDAPLECIVVTSTRPSEGKSTLIANYAVTLANMWKRVLLVDCDLRNPTQSRLFELPRGKGITNVLIGDTNLKDCIVKTKVDNLDLLDCGVIPPNPSELMASASFTKMIDTLKGAYDYILIDTPPIGVVSDAMLLKDVADGYILVVEMDGLDRKELAQSVETIKNAKVNFIGSIVNKMAIKRSGYYGYYYYGDYYGKHEK